jgi:hypothetical protein
LATAAIMPVLRRDSSPAGVGRTPSRSALLLLCALALAVVIAGCGDATQTTNSSRPQPLPLPLNHPLTSVSPAATGSVSVYPVPGTQYAMPATQITLRGISPAKIGKVTVTGSQTGLHTGRLEGDSDGRGASFVPSKPFAAGETVTVSTSLPVLGATNGTWRFTVEDPSPQIGPGKLSAVASVAGGVSQFVSASGLRPATVSIQKSGDPPNLGDIFVAPQDGPLQDGPMILSASGDLVWFHPTSLKKNLLTTDFRVQMLHGQRVLTWWQGNQNRGSGRGVGVIENDHYRRIATVHAGNGLQADLHEFLVTNAGDAWVIAASPVSLPGSSRPVINSVVQEIDIKTGLVLFEWDALDHVPLKDSYKYSAKTPGHVLDPYHMNSISPLPGGDVLVSMRNTSAAYEINTRTGSIVWELGGKHSSFAMGAGTTTAFQHDVVAHGDGIFTEFDNGGGPPRVHPFSRALTVKLDERTMSAKLERSDDSTPQLAAAFEGSVQPLAGGQTFVGYGQQPYFLEFNAAGTQDLTGHFVTSTDSYRAYRLRWVGWPLTHPSIAVRQAGQTDDGSGSGSLKVFASWNGATQVSRWRVLAGDTPTKLRVVTTARRSSFETSITIRAERYVKVQAVGQAGATLGSSRTVHVRTGS